MSFRPSRSIVLSVVACCGLALGAWLYATSDWINDAYAQWGAADMTIDYMKTHEGRWPKSWDDLEPQFRTHNGRVAGWDFEHFQQRVDIDFTCDVEQLRRESLASPQATFHVIRPRHPLAAHFGAGPDQMLCDYFRTTAPKD